MFLGTGALGGGGGGVDSCRLRWTVFEDSASSRSLHDGHQRCLIFAKIPGHLNSHRGDYGTADHLACDVVTCSFSVRMSDIMI